MSRFIPSLFPNQFTYQFDLVVLFLMCDEHFFKFCFNFVLAYAVNALLIFIDEGPNRNPMPCQAVDSRILLIPIGVPTGFLMDRYELSLI